MKMAVSLADGSALKAIDVSGVIPRHILNNIQKFKKYSAF